MSSHKGEKLRAWNEPEPREGPHVPYKIEAAGSNPVLRGYSLAIVSTIIASSTWLQGLFWKLNKFDKLKEIKELEDYDPRHDPTVIPRLHSATETFSLTDLPCPQPRNSPTSYYSCADYHELYKAGRITPLDVAQYLLPLIQRHGKTPGTYSIAFLQVREDLVLAAAEASTERYKLGKPLSVLDGVPITIKDEVDLKGYERVLGSNIDHTDPGDRTAWCVQKWQDAGAIVMGKTNMHELGLDTTNNNPNFGTPLNPHNQGYYTGGSSGGSACVVAQGLFPFALGVDGGGSIRIPSSFCGLYGLKTSHGRVSARAGPEYTTSVSVDGPIASSMDDLALAYRIMAQPDPDSRRNALFPNSLSKALITGPSQTEKKYIGVCHDWINRSDPVVRDMFNRAVKHYVKTQGYETVDIDIPFLPEGQKAHALTILAEIRAKITPEKISKLTYSNQLLMNVIGSHASGLDFLFAQKMRSLLMSHLAWLWKQHPGLLILTPTNPMAGWKIRKTGDNTDSYGVSDSDMSLRSMEYVWMANFTGAPAISCPMGYAEGNVPVGLMAMGEWGSEEQLIIFGKEGEMMVGEDGIQRPKVEGQWLDVIVGAKNA